MVRKPGPLKRGIAILCLAALCIAGATIHFVTVERPVIEARLNAAAPANVVREQTLQQLFQAAGCTGAPLIEQPAKHAKLPNLVCKLIAETGRTIVVERTSIM